MREGAEQATTVRKDQETSVEEEEADETKGSEERKEAPDNAERGAKGGANEPSETEVGAKDRIKEMEKEEEEGHHSGSEGEKIDFLTK